MIHLLFEESTLGTCSKNREVLKKALTILSLDCCSTDSGLELQHFQPPANPACFRLALTILIGKGQFLNIYPVLTVLNSVVFVY